MTERQKMLAGELYWGNDPELAALRDRARALFEAYNRTYHAHPEAGRAILRELLAPFPGPIDIQAPFYCDYVHNFHVGINFFANFNLQILDCAKITIGDNVMFGPNVQLYTAYHPLVARERLKGPELAAPITIEDNCWLGGGVIVCQNVTIGANTTIGAGSVVVKDVPANVFAAGNPCKVIRELPR